MGINIGNNMMGINMGNNMMGINMGNSAKAWTTTPSLDPPPQHLRNQITKMRPAVHFCDLISGKAEFSAPPTI